MEKPENKLHKELRSVKIKAGIVIALWMIALAINVSQSDWYGAFLNVVIILLLINLAFYESIIVNYRSFSHELMELVDETQAIAGKILADEKKKKGKKNA